MSGCGGGGGGGSTAGGTGSGGGSTTPSPAITSISPTSVAAGSTALVLTVNGSEFTSGSVVQVGGTSEVTTYVNASQLTATIPASQITNGAELTVDVEDGGVSSSGAAVKLEVDNPAPTIGSFSPSQVTVGTASAEVVVTGKGFTPSTVIDVNGTSRTTTFTSATQVSVTLASADLAAAESLSLTAVNPAPGGGTSAAASLSVVAATLPTPTIGSVAPNKIYTGSPDTTISVYGSGFTKNSVIQWNGTPLTTSWVSGSYFLWLMATVPAADFSSAGTASVTVQTPGAAPAVSTAVSVTITDPPAPTLIGLSPGAGPIGAASKVTLQGTGFVPSSKVTVNGVVVDSTWNGSTTITANIPASSLALPGNVNITVTTPAPGGGTSAAQPFTAYLPIDASDIVYNAKDGLLYASVPASGGGVSGNSVAGIDPLTGNVTRQIWVGSNPNKLALSSDGTQLFVGLDGAASVAQVDLNQGKVVNRIALGGGTGIYNAPMTALDLAAVPGSPNSVAVATESGPGSSGGGIKVYDSGVARANVWSAGEGPMSFGSSSSTLYVLSGSTVEELTLGSSGITAATALANLNGQASWLQYDHGKLYLSSGQVLDAANGTLQGTFYSSTNAPAYGAVVSDSSLSRAFVATNSFGSNSETVLAFDETSFNLIGSTSINAGGESGYGVNPRRIVRWGQNGLAVNIVADPFNSQSQLLIFQSPVVKNLSSSPADLSVTLTAPATATTGNSTSWVVTVNNLGPNAASGATAAISLDPSLVIGSVKPSTGLCATGTILSCDLGTLASGASATITIAATPTQAGTLAATASVASVSYDPKSGNNQASSSTTVTGGIYGALPSVSAISPSLVQAGSGDFTLTVTGAGFNANSVVNLAGGALSTTFVSATQLTATVTSAEIAKYGWAPITVSNPAPGGGVSQVLPLTIYQIVTVPASGLVFDPYAQLLYATVPSTSTTVKGNSVVSIDPATGTVGTPIAVGSQPTVMAETSDGKYLYVGLSGANSLAQFDLLKQSVTATIPLSLTQSGTKTSVTATYLAAMPGSDTTLAINVSNGWDNFGIFDIAGSTGSFRPNLSGIYSGIDPVFADASHVYAYDSQTSGAEFYRYSVDANGLNLIDGTTLDGMGGFQGSIQLANGLVYGEGGGIANPSTTPPSQIATLPLIDFYGAGETTFSVGAAPDPSLRKDFLILENPGGALVYGLVRYDLNTYLPEAYLNLPASVSTFNSGLTTLRWGQDGLALITSNSIASDSPTPSVMLLRGPFVAPQELETETAATLTASSLSTIAHGSGNTMLTLTGTNFLPGTAVTWNGGYRTTTIVDATHLLVAIPASDLASAGSASLAATNPGAPASNKITVTIN